jgi:SH3-like domain-containing protein
MRLENSLPLSPCAGRIGPARRAAALCVAAGLALALGGHGLAGAETARSVGPATGQPLPRFESLATDEAYGRRGPGFDHRIEWVYRHRGLPVQVLEEAKGWRRVIDPAGESVWMAASRLTAKRTAIVTQAPASGAPLFAAPRAGAQTIARVEVGASGALVGCIGPWREVDFGAHRGWLAASALWGAPDCQGIG